MLNLQLKKEIKEYSLSKKGEEICGLIIIKDNNYIFYKCKNISYNKQNHSVINPLDYIGAEKTGKIVGAVHSQPSDKISLMDEMTAIEHNIFSIVYCFESDKFYIINPELSFYLTKDFDIDKANCFTLVRDFYLNRLNIKLNHYNINEDWFEKNPNLIYEIFTEQRDKWEQISLNLIQENDIIIFGRDFETLNHMGIYLGNNLMLHHPRNNKSIIEDLDDRYKKKIHLMIRYNK